MSIKWQPTPGKVSLVREYTGTMHPLDAVDVAFFEEHYELPEHTARAAICVNRESGRYVLPIFGPDNIRRGYVVRIPWDGAPRSCPFSHALPKADTFKRLNQPLQSHYWAEEGYYPDELVLVEDQLSAIKLSAHGYDSVALLGVPDISRAGYTGADRVTEIARRAKDRPVIIALDSDMTEVSFLFAKKWRHAFSSIRVAMLEQDLKDTKAKDFSEVLGC